MPPTEAVPASAAPPGHEYRRIAVDGVELNVLLAGEGEPVLLVHGFPDDHRVWRRQIDALVDAGYRVIAPDTRGCGESSVPPRVADYRVERLVDDLRALLDTLGIPRVRLVAHDWGAVIAWRFVIAHPGRVERFVALSVGHPTAYGRAGLAQKLRGWYVVFMQLRGIAEWLVTCGGWRLFRAFAGHDDEFPAWRASLSRPGRLSAAMSYYRANPGLLLGRRFPPARVPVLGVWSSGDRFLTERQMTNSARHVQGDWRYERIEGASHWLQLDAPERLNPLLLAYLG